MNQSKKQAAQAAFILAAAGVLTACASTSPNLASPQPSIDAQAALGQAVKSQMYSSFSYQTDFYVSNQLQVKHLETASPEQLAAADNPNDRCEHEHDQAYVALLNRTDVQEADFLAVKKTYQDCVSQNNQAAELTLKRFYKKLKVWTKMPAWPYCLKLIRTQLRPRMVMWIMIATTPPWISKNHS